jgi:hypothetical protein
MRAAMPKVAAAWLLQAACGYFLLTQGEEAESNIIQAITTVIRKPAALSDVAEGTKTHKDTGQLSCHGRRELVKHQ